MGYKIHIVAGLLIYLTPKRYKIHIVAKLLIYLKKRVRREANFM